MMSAGNGHTAIVTALLSAGADVNTEDKVHLHCFMCLRIMNRP